MVNGKKRCIIFVFRRISLVCLVCMSVFYFSGCFLLPGDEAAAVAPVALKEPKALANVVTEKVKRGSIVREKRFWAKFLSPQVCDLKFTSVGKLKSIHVQENDYVKAGEVLAELDGEDYSSELKRLEITLRKAQLSYEKLKTQWDMEGGGDKYRLAEAELNIQLVQIQIDHLTRTMLKNRLIAPVSGLVAHVRRLDPGETVDIQTDFITLSERSGLRLVAKKDQSLESLSVGMKVKVLYADREYTGEILEMPEDTMTGRDPVFHDVCVIGVKDLKLDSVSLNDTAEVVALLHRTDGVLVINKSNIVSSGDTSLVYVLEKGVIREREIEVGAEAGNGVEVEVKKGLYEGDEIVVR